MASFYSGLVSSSGTSLGTLPYVAPGFLAGARVRTKVARITVASGTDLATSDKFYFATMNSGDRILDLRLGNDQFPASTTVDIGLYLRGSNHDGAVVDADLFASAVDLNTARTGALVSVFAENFATSTVGASDAGKTLWQLADLGAATLTADPRVEYDIIATEVGNPSATGSDLDILLLIDYIAGV